MNHILPVTQPATNRLTMEKQKNARKRKISLVKSSSKLILALIQPASKWMHWATLRHYFDLFWAATFASSQVIPTLNKSLLTVLLQFCTQMTWTSLKSRNLPVQNSTKQWSGYNKSQNCELIPRHSSSHVWECQCLEHNASHAMYIFTTDNHLMTNCYGSYSFTVCGPFDKTSWILVRSRPSTDCTVNYFVTRPAATDTDRQVKRLEASYIRGHSSRLSVMCLVHCYCMV